ncbi:hypothetical protein AURDEDRAFT_176992 [Auricularia subglabra TFB-10046 SS5]|uniref:Uncharacterized protein n=1 Tax=Auricularia subglabra (strain TFB-10046 / SS5) TaxID=717982 RepID=J0WQ18_AURST|nr:hypothetical protein AURDEDRAFT_176992 [Auricularia subglabra TFB-10046 SS5]
MNFLHSSTLPLGGPGGSLPSAESLAFTDAVCVPETCLGSGGRDVALDAQTPSAPAAPMTGTDDVAPQSPPYQSSPIRPDPNDDHPDSNTSTSDIVTYRVEAHGLPLLVRPDTSQLANYISKSAAIRMGAVVLRDVYDKNGDAAVLAEVRCKVDFNGMVEDVVASVLNNTPGDVDLILGLRWIRGHRAYDYWAGEEFCFDDGLHHFYLDSVRAQKSTVRLYV